MNIFEIAARMQFRYQSERGLLTTEQLFTLPLKAKSGFDLDSVAKAVNADLKAVSEESFVDTGSSENRTLHEQRLEVVKFVIADKKQKAADAAAATERAERRRKILELLAKKQDAALEQKSEEELLKELEALG